MFRLVLEGALLGTAGFVAYQSVTNSPVPARVQWDMFWADRTYEAARAMRKQLVQKPDPKKELVYRAEVQKADEGFQRALDAMFEAIQSEQSIHRMRGLLPVLTQISSFYDELRQVDKQLEIETKAIDILETVVQAKGDAEDTDAMNAFLVSLLVNKFNLCMRNDKCDQPPMEILKRANLVSERIRAAPDEATRAELVPMVAALKLDLAAYFMKENVESEHVDEYVKTAFKMMDDLYGDKPSAQRAHVRYQHALDCYFGKKNSPFKHLVNQSVSELCKIEGAIPSPLLLDMFKNVILHDLQTEEDCKGDFAAFDVILHKVLKKEVAEQCMLALQTVAQVHDEGAVTKETGASADHKS